MYQVDAEEVTQRARLLLKSYTHFMCKAGFSPIDYKIDYTVLKTVAMRYWIDVERLKHFHNMSRINSHKIAGYLTYWICKLRPITVKSQSVYLNADLKPMKHPHFINELFAATVGVGRLNEGRSKGVAVSASVFDTFIYGLKYRTMTGDMLSMMFNVIDDCSPR